MSTTQAYYTGPSTEPKLPDAGLDGADIAVIVVYFLFVLGVGLWVGLNACFCYKNAWSILGNV